MHFEWFEKRWNTFTPNQRATPLPPYTPHISTPNYILPESDVQGFVYVEGKGYYHLLLCFCVCLIKRSLHTETRLGPDWARLEQNAQARFWKKYKYAGIMIYGNKR